MDEERKKFHDRFMMMKLMRRIYWGWAVLLILLVFILDNPEPVVTPLFMLFFCYNFIAALYPCPRCGKPLGFKYYGAFMCLGNPFGIMCAHCDLPLWKSFDKVEHYRDRGKPHDSPLPHHAAYGSVLRDSADPRQGQIQGNKRPSEVK